MRTLPSLYDKVIQPMLTEWAGFDLFFNSDVNALHSALLAWFYRRAMRVKADHAQPPQTVEAWYAEWLRLELAVVEHRDPMNRYSRAEHIRYFLDIPEGSPEALNPCLVSAAEWQRIRGEG